MSDLGYCYDLDDVVNKQSALHEMSRTLDGLEYATAAALATRELIGAIRALDAKVRALQPVWEAIDRWDGANSEQRAREACERYAAEHGTPALGEAALRQLMAEARDLSRLLSARLVTEEAR